MSSTLTNIDAIHTDAENYRDLAGRTEMIPQTARGLGPAEHKLFRAILSRMDQLTEAAEKLKRHLIYGDEMEESELDDLAEAVENDFSSGEDYPTDLDPTQIRIVHAMLGKISEAGEVVHAVQEVNWDPTKVDRSNLSEEIGDSWWHDMILARLYGLKPADIMSTNIRKLAARYGEKFSQDAAINRDTEKERQVLKKNTEAGRNKAFNDEIDAPGLNSFDHKIKDRLDYFEQDILKDVIANRGNDGDDDVAILAGPDELASIGRLSYYNSALKEAKADPKEQILMQSWDPVVSYFFHDIPIVDTKHPGTLQPIAIPVEFP